MNNTEWKQPGRLGEASLPEQPIGPCGGEKFSTVWKNSFHSVEKNGRFFHTMEKSFAIFPHNGKNVSTVWKKRESQARASGSGGSSAFLPLAEEADKLAVVGLAGVEFDGIGTGAAQLPQEGAAPLGLAGEQGAAGGGVGGVHPDPLAGLGVLEVDEADGGQRAFALVADDETDQVVAAGGDAQEAVRRAGR